MTYSIEDIKNEWQKLGARGHLCDHVYRWYIHTYDHTNQFIGFARKAK